MELEQLPKKDLDLIFRDGKAIDEAMHQAFLEAVRQHRMNGVPMVFWKDGKIVKVPADQLNTLATD